MYILYSINIYTIQRIITLYSDNNIVKNTHYLFESHLGVKRILQHDEV